MSVSTISLVTVEYKVYLPQSRHNLTQFAQDGLASSHLTFLRRHVRHPVLRFGPERPVPFEWIAWSILHGPWLLSLS